MAARNIYIYVRYVVTLGLITPRACINVAESAFLKFIFMGQGNSGKTISCSGVDSNLGLMHALQTTAFATEPMGLWQLWTAILAHILLTAAVSVDYSERPWPSGISGESQQTQVLQGIFTVLF